jgi:hypothetical protein
MVMLVGCTAPAPRPWMARAAISVVMLQANPQSTEPSTNAAIPNSMTGFRPNRSDSLP